MLLSSTCVQKGGFAMNIVEERTEVQKELDHRICSHISRGSRKAYEIISNYHMDTIANIRSYMIDVLGNDCLYDARALNSAFYMAVSSLEINLSDLLSEDIKIIKDKRKVVGLVI